MTIASEIQLLSPSALIELFVLDANKYAGGVLYWHAGTNELTGDIVWGGQTYSRFPIEASGFDKRSGGTTPRPTITAANVGGTLAASARQYSDFMGCKLTRIRTFARYLDAVNFPGGVNPSADPSAAFPPDIYYVDRKTAETPTLIQWELAAAFDMVGVMLPRRQVIQNCCAWVYRSAECGFAGGAVAIEDGTATTVLANDKCGKRLSDCRLRFPQPATLPFGGFPGVGLVH
jgi:lambda family phage minor tail protein L